MADDLNKQYFEAKETHKRNYIRKGYVIWILIGIGIVVFYFGRQYFEGRKYETLKKEKTNEFLEQGIHCKADTIVTSGLTGTSVLILKDYIYKDFQSEFGSTFVAVKNDSSGLGYFTKRIVPSPDYKSSMQQWKNQLTSTGPSYKFANMRMDTVNGLPIEIADIEIVESGQAPMIGKIQITKKGPLYYVFQIYAFANTWKLLLEERTKIENSFKIVE